VQDEILFKGQAVRFSELRIIKMSVRFNKRPSPVGTHIYRIIQNNFLSCRDT